MPENFIPDSEFKPDAIAPGRDPAEGKPAQNGFIPDSDFQPDDEKYGTVGQQVKTGLEGAARGATLGLSDVVESKLFDNAKDIKARRETNPVTSGAGNLLGGAGALIATGGLAAPAEAALGGGLAARAIGFGAEGALFGAGNAVTDAALGDPNLTAEKVLSDIGMGAAFGSGLGVISKGVEAILPRATEKLSKALSSLKESAVGSGEAPGFAVRAAAVPGSILTGETPESWAKAFYDGLKRPDGSVSSRSFIKNLNEVVENSKEAAAQLYDTAVPANLSKSLEGMPVNQARSNAEEIFQNILLKTEEATPNQELVSKLSPGPAKDLDARLLKLDDDLQTAKTAVDVHDALSGFAKDLDKGKLIKFDTMPTAAQQADQEILKDIRNTVRGSLRDENIWGEAAHHYGQTADQYSAYKDALKNFQGAFMKKEKTGSFVMDPGKVGTFFNRFGSVSQDLKAQYLDTFINETQNLAKASENYHGFESGSETISNRVSELAKKHQQLSEVAQALAENKPGFNQQSATVPAGVAAFAAHSLGVPNPVVGAALAGAGAIKAIKNPYELGATLGPSFQKLHAIAEISGSVGKKIESGAKSIFSNSALRAAPSIPQMAADNTYDKKVKRIAELTDQQKLMDHLERSTDSIQEAAPNVSQALQMKMTNAVGFLNSKIPKPQNHFPLSFDWEPSNAQKQEFNEYYMAVDSPLSIMKDVKNGTLSNASMEALQAVHPELLKEMQSAVMGSLNPKTAKDLNYGTKISLSKFLGQPVDETMVPQTILENQLSLSGPSLSEQSAPKQRQSKISSSAIKDLDFSGRARSQTNREPSE